MSVPYLLVVTVLATATGTPQPTVPQQTSFPTQTACQQALTNLMSASQGLQIQAQCVPQTSQ